MGNVGSDTRGRERTKSEKVTTLLISTPFYHELFVRGDAD